MSYYPVFAARFPYGVQLQTFTASSISAYRFIIYGIAIRARTANEPYTRNFVCTFLIIRR